MTHLQKAAAAKGGKDGRGLVAAQRVCGAISGATARTCVAPLRTAFKTLLLEHWVSGHKGQCGALSAQKQYIATAAASAKQQAPQMTAAPQPQPSLKKSTEATNSAPSLFSPTQLSNLLSTRPQELGVGLVNRGNTCYINSVLQCFSHTAPLRAYLDTPHTPTTRHDAHSTIGQFPWRCNKVVTAQKQLTVDRAPPILVVQLK